MSDKTVSEINQFFNKIMDEDLADKPMINKMKIIETCGGTPQYDGSGKGVGKTKDRKGLKRPITVEGDDKIKGKKKVQYTTGMRKDVAEELPNETGEAEWAGGAGKSKATKKSIKRMPKCQKDGEEEENTDECNCKDSEEEFENDGEELEDYEEEFSEEIGTPSRIKRFPRVGDKVNSQSSVGKSLNFSQENKRARNGQIIINRWRAGSLVKSINGTQATPDNPKYTEKGQRNIQRFHNTDL